MLHQTGNPAGPLPAFGRQRADLRILAFAGLYFACLAPVPAQFTDDFSDSIFLPWQGDTANFILNTEGVLQLQAPAGSTSANVHVPVTFSDSMRWSIHIRLDFAPSASNRVRIWLGRTSAEIDETDGYLLEIGETGDQDALVFYTVDHGSAIPVARSAPGLFAAEPVDLVLLAEARQGQWTFTDATTGIPIPLFAAYQNAIPLSALNYFGLECNFTSTRRDKFRFDDVAVLPWQPDTIPPVCLGLEISSDRALRLRFDESLDPVIAEDTGHYRLSPALGMPASAQLEGGALLLTWSQPFASDTSYMLSLAGLMDLHGNAMDTIVLAFTWVRIDTASPQAILITEIMADPTPAVSLPEVEYVELYNAGSGNYNLVDILLRIGDMTVDLPDALLRPGQYIVVCAPDDADRLDPYGRTAPVSGLPVLPNAGTTVRVISRATNQTLHQVTYSINTYGDSSKDDGGWSLEMQNPLASCSGEGNWRASEDLRGGTPGWENEAWMATADVEGPVLLRWQVDTTNALVLFFDEDLDTGLMRQKDRYDLSPALLISTIAFPAPGIVRVVFADTLTPSIAYHLRRFPAFDCLGNAGENQGQSVVFGQPTLPLPNDLIINEVLFEPAAGGSRYVEIKNISGRFIDLRSLLVGRIGAEGPQLYPCGLAAMLPPGRLCAISPDTADVLRRYAVMDRGMLFEAGLPAWSAETDNVSILANGLVLDSFTYFRAWHHPLYRETRGVSLERIAVWAPAGEPGSWHSAAGVRETGTPTGENSQQLSGPADTLRLYTVTDRIFSPNNDGNHDFLAVRFAAGSTGWSAGVMIHDLEGRLVSAPLGNLPIGANSLVTWDGRRSDGTPAEMGIYVIFLRLWTPDGQVAEFTESCAIVER